MSEFERIKRLPPYVFSIVTDLKMKARRAGEDIIDLGMGNPDLPTPPHIVSKLVEAAQKPPRRRIIRASGCRIRAESTDTLMESRDINSPQELMAVVDVEDQNSIAGFPLILRRIR